MFGFGSARSAGGASGGKSPFGTPRSSSAAPQTQQDRLSQMAQSRYRNRSGQQRSGNRFIPQRENANPWGQSNEKTPFVPARTNPGTGGSPDFSGGGNPLVNGGGPGITTPAPSPQVPRPDFSGGGNPLVNGGGPGITEPVPSPQAPRPDFSGGGNPLVNGGGPGITEPAPFQPPPRPDFSGGGNPLVNAHPQYGSSSAATQRYVQSLGLDPRVLNDPDSEKYIRAAEAQRAGTDSSDFYQRLYDQANARQQMPQGQAAASQGIMPTAEDYARAERWRNDPANQAEMQRRMKEFEKQAQDYAANQGPSKLQQFRDQGLVEGRDYVIGITGEPVDLRGSGSAQSSDPRQGGSIYNSQPSVGDMSRQVPSPAPVDRRKAGWSPGILASLYGNLNGRLGR